MTHKDVTEEWKRLCRNRKIPTTERGAVPVLKETDSKVRDAGIRWYTGSFPGEPDIISCVLGDDAYKIHKSRVNYGMRMDIWNRGERKRTTESIKVLVDAIETYWKMGKRTRSRYQRDTEGDDEEWHPKRVRR